MGTFVKGKSGNPATQFEVGNPGGPGRPKKNPITDRLRAHLEQPIPNDHLELLRTKDAVIAALLPKKPTWGDLVALMQILRAVDETDAAKLVAELTEGKPRMRVELTGDEGGAVAIEDVNNRLRDKLLKGK